jgi:hypothetical protein
MMENLRPNKKRANTAIIFIWIIFGIEILSLFSSFLQYMLLNDASTGKFISEESANLNDLREKIIGFTHVIIFIISGIIFIRWFRRAYYNLHLVVDKLNHSEGWAAGFWFIPIANMYRPFQIMKELFGETINYLRKNNIESNIPSLKPINWWWSLWIINEILGRIIFQYSRRAETIDELIFSTKLDMVGCLIGLPLCIITVSVIKNYSLLEDKLIKIDRENFNQI